MTDIEFLRERLQGVIDELEGIEAEDMPPSQQLAREDIFKHLNRAMTELWECYGLAEREEWNRFYSTIHKVEMALAGALMDASHYHRQYGEDILGEVQDDTAV